MKKFSKAVALLAAGALLFGGLFLSCSDDSSNEKNPQEETGGTTTGSDAGSGSSPATDDSGSTGEDETVELEEVAAGWTGTKDGTVTTTDADGNPTTWWYTFAGDDVQAKAGTKVTTTMTVTDHNGANWNVGPAVILRKADKTEYLVVRPDNYGWGTAYSEDIIRDNNYAWTQITGTENWIMDGNAAGGNAWFKGATLKITVANNNGTVAIRYDYSKDSTTYYQSYTGIAADATDTYVNLCFDGCVATFASSSSGGSGSTAQITASASWTFGDMGDIAIEGVDASTALTSADALASAETKYTTFGAANAKFSLKSDVSYPASTGSGSLTVKSLGSNDAPIQYNKYEPTTQKGSGSAGCLTLKEDALYIASVQGPFKVTVAKGATSGADPTDGRTVYVKINGKKADSTTDIPGTNGTGASDWTYSYTGTDIVSVTIGSSNFARIYDVKITK